MEFVRRYKEAETIKEKIMCRIVKIIGAKYVTPLDRIILLHDDYEKEKKKYT